MAFPIIAAVAGQAIVQVMTKPWPWIIIGIWFAASKVDFGLLATDVKNTILQFWWLAILTIVLLIVRRYLILLVKREKSASRKE